MTITFSVKHLTSLLDRSAPVHLSGQLWLDAAGACLFDWTEDLSVVLADPEAVAALRLALSEPGDYLGGVLMQAWVRESATGLELYNLYWIQLGIDENTAPRFWGEKLVIRPVPPQYDHSR